MEAQISILISARVHGVQRVVGEKEQLFKLQPIDILAHIQLTFYGILEVEW